MSKYCNVIQQARSFIEEGASRETYELEAILQGTVDEEYSESMT